jgi:Icc protein
MHQSPGNIHCINASGDVVRLLQLTDTHLCQIKGGTLLGMDTDQSLQAVIELVQDERPAVDVLVGTGDLADRGAREAYERLQAYFAQIPCDNFWLPGNHDDRNAMAAVVNPATRLCKEIRVSHWQILMLDSQVPGEVGGELGQAELALLEQMLQSARDEGLYTLVCLHHQPVAIGCTWLDEQMVADAPAFFDVLDRYPGVRGVLWGHVHQQIDRQRNGVSLMASPSTCVQFAPGSVNFKADNLQPGYRWLDLHGDGRIETAVSRLSDTQIAVKPGSGGYL